MNLPWLTFFSTIVHTHTHTHTHSQGERTAAKEEESRFDRKLSRGRAFFFPFEIPLEIKWNIAGSRRTKKEKLHVDLKVARWLLNQKNQSVTMEWIKFFFVFLPQSSLACLPSRRENLSIRFWLLQVVIQAEARDVAGMR